LAGSHEVVELMPSVKVGAFSDVEQGIKETSKMGNLLGQKIEGDIALSR